MTDYSISLQIPVKSFQAAITMHFPPVCTYILRTQNLNREETKDSLNKKRGKPVILEQLLVLSVRWCDASYNFIRVHDLFSSVIVRGQEGKFSRIL